MVTPQPQLHQKSISTQRHRTRSLAAHSTNCSGYLRQEPWKGITPYPGNSWRTPSKGGYSTWIQQNIISDWPDAYPTVYDRLDALNDAGLVYWPPNGTVPCLKRYLAASKGRVAEDIFVDINKLQSVSKERVGYPTQKPVALIQRLIQASSNEGDWVLDPFCGCATTCIAAQQTNRQWIGIDISPKAAQLVAHRLETELGLFNTHNPRTDLPQRTDQTHIPPPHTHKHTLYGTQEGKCNGCQHHFPYRNLTIDHKTPRSKGGTNHPNNLQLLCQACNSLKGTGTMNQLHKKLKHT